MSALHTLIEYTPEPALLLSTSSTIVAANASLGRLTAPFHDGSAAKSLVGRSVDDLNIALIPDNKRVYQCLHAFLGGVLFQEPSQSHFRATKAVRDGNGFSRFSESTQHTTSRFWSGEAAIASVQEVDVFIPHHDSYAAYTEKDSCEKTTSLVRAQMRGRRLYQNDQTFCMITFHKPTLKQDSATTPDLERHSFRCWSSQGGSDGNDDLRLSLTSSTSTDSGEQRSGMGIHNCRATLDCEGQATEFSPAWYALTGMTPSESLGSGWVMAIHPEDVPDMLLSWNRVVEDGLDDWSYQSRYRMRDGSYRHCLVGVTALRGENGRVQKWVASMLDVNRSVLESMETERHKQSILNLVSQADVSLWSVTSCHRLDFREGSLPWDPSLSLERESSDICCAVDAQEDDKIGKTIQDILDSKVSAITLEHQAGHRWYRTRFMADIEENTTSVEGPSLVRAALGLTIDITDVRARTVLQIDNERLALNERAARDASSLKSQFLANMSHEIRTPISGIIGLSELMIQSNLDQDQQEYVTTISQSAESLLAIINDILDFSKIEAGHMDIETTAFRPKKIVDCLRSLMSLPAGEKNLQIDCQYELEDDLTLLGDPGRLRQILTNLLSNAIKFTEEGSITLTVRGSPLPPPSGLALGKAVDPQSSTFGWSGNSASGKYIEFVVEDTGCGISDETMKRLFRPFSQADSSTARTHGGTGLGLTISRRLAELMGGSIDLCSPRSGGCRGTLWIPFRRCMSEGSPDSCPIIRSINPISYRKSLKAAYQASVPGVPCPIERQILQDHVELELASRNDIHILVVEDNPVNQTIVSANLKKLGFTMSIVENGKQALTYLDGVATSKETVPNVILMDCMMPVMDGYDTTQTLRNDAQRFSTALRQTPIIALTASAIQGDRERCKAAGMNDYLTKPVSRDNLKRAIDAWILKANDDMSDRL